jgi:4'-phosphopantetheinyl transferase
VHVDAADCGPVGISWAQALPASAATSVLDELGPQQRSRYEALEGLAASRFLAGRMLLARAIGEFTPGDFRLETRCAVCGAHDHGALRTASGQVSVSVSYAGDLVMAAAAAAHTARAVGIDVEAHGHDGAMDDLRMLFAPGDPPTIAEWTRIEAAVKADGRGLHLPPNLVVVSEQPGTLLPGGRLVALPGRAMTIEVAAAPGPKGYSVSVAIDPASGSEP